MTTTTATLKAANITRKLNTAGFTKAEWRKPMVSTWNEGFLTETMWITNGVYVSWTLAGYSRNVSEEEITRIQNNLEQMSVALRNLGFVVTKKDGSDKSCDYLEVTPAN